MDFWLTPLYLFPDLTNQTNSLYVKCKLLFRLALGGLNVSEIYGSIPKDLKFDWSIQITWKRRELVNLIHWAYSLARKLTNTPAIIFCYLCRRRWFIFTKQIIVLLWVIIYCNKIGVIKKLYTIQRKKTMSKSLLNQPVAC